MAHVAARVVYVDAVDVAVLAHVVRLAHTLGLSVTAEPVETAAQLRRLQALGRDVGQGGTSPRPATPARSRRWYAHRWRLSQGTARQQSISDDLALDLAGALEDRGQPGVAPV
ncbi:MAG: EAL domain-containing protein, partial [Pseudonocardia sp.]|nr:EAL domain-containing protein [Pseudonocardia sp.]